jgi:hypothetical protein
MAKLLEKEVRRLVLAMKALADAPPEKFDSEEARKLQLDFAAIALIHNTEQEAVSDRRYFAWLEKNVPSLGKIRGRPGWFESKKVLQHDEALLKEFEETRQNNVAANRGKTHRASQKTYADLTEKGGVSDDEYTIKQAVMRARRRQKALKESFQEILSIAALAEKDRNKPPTAKEYKRRRKKLIEAFRRIVTTK